MSEDNLKVRLDSLIAQGKLTLGDGISSLDELFREYCLEIAFFMGPRQGGKSTSAKEYAAAKVAEGDWSIINLAFADPIYSMINEQINSGVLTPNTSEHLTTPLDKNKLKNLKFTHKFHSGSVNEFASSGRELLVAIGEGTKIAQGRDIWAMLLVQRLTRLLGKSTISSERGKKVTPKNILVCIDDLRYPEEINYIANRLDGFSTITGLPSKISVQFVNKTDQTFGPDIPGEQMSNYFLNLSRCTSKNMRVELPKYVQHYSIDEVKLHQDHFQCKFKHKHA